MQISEKIRKSPKRVVFDVSEEDHETIKKLAASKRMTMRNWIINSMAEAIKRDAQNVVE